MLNCKQDVFFSCNYERKITERLSDVQPDESSEVLLPKIEFINPVQPEKCVRVRKSSFLHFLNKCCNSDKNKSENAKSKVEVEVNSSWNGGE